MRSILLAGAVLALAGCANSGTGSIPKPPSPTAHREAETAKAHRG